MTNPAQRYLDINAQIKALEAEKEALRDELMELVDAPPAGYSIKMVESSADRLEGLKAIQDRSQSLFDALHMAGCIKQVISKRLTVCILNTTLDE